MDFEAAGLRRVWMGPASSMARPRSRSNHGADFAEGVADDIAVVEAKGVPS